MNKKQFRIDCGEVCGICGVHQGACKQSHAVDHNHLTEQVRGILCVQCNTGLGCFRGDITTEFLRDAITYLENNDNVHCK